MSNLSLKVLMNFLCTSLGEYSGISENIPLFSKLRALRKRFEG